MREGRIRERRRSDRNNVHVDDERLSRRDHQRKQFTHTYSDKP